MVGYKRIEQAIQAANREGFPLIIFGDGPEMGRLTKLAGPTVSFVGSVSPAQLSDLIQQSRAFLFPGVEDFGILPVEVQAGGCPVIALAEGGALETVRHGETGLLYEDNSAEGLIDAIHQFEKRTFNPKACQHNAQRFNRNRFEEEIVGIIRRMFSET
jgi:glycosyltransferase involved in cell wall biosynthesis